MGRKFIILTEDFATDIVDLGFLGIGFSEHNRPREAYEHWVKHNNATAEALIGHDVIIMDLSEIEREVITIKEEDL